MFNSFSSDESYSLSESNDSVLDTPNTFVYLPKDRFTIEEFKNKVFEKHKDDNYDEIPDRICEGCEILDTFEDFNYITGILKSGDYKIFSFEKTHPKIYNLTIVSNTSDVKIVYNNIILKTDESSMYEYNIGVNLNKIHNMTPNFIYTYNIIKDVNNDDKFKYLI